MSNVSPVRIRERRAVAGAASALPAVPIPELEAASPRIAITYQLLGAIQPLKRQLRKRGKGQIDRLSANISRFGMVSPILTTGSGEIIDGHGVFEACQRLGLVSIPTIIIDHLSPDEIQSLRISINRLSEMSSWDPQALAAELKHLLAVDPDLTAFTGFTMPEIDVTLAAASIGLPGSDSADSVPDLASITVSRAGDLWLFDGGHKLLCGNAREETSYAAVLDGLRAQKVAADPPFGCTIRGHDSGKHREFLEDSGIDEAQSLLFFQSFLTAMVPHLADGAIVDMFIDWRGMTPLLEAARLAGLSQLGLCVWDKCAGGQGSLYRQQLEFVLILKHGRGKHINNVSLGRHGRNRTNLWSVPGLAQFGGGRQEALALHPTVKPVGLLADALLDTSCRGGAILDPFCGSGTTLLAAHRTGRIGHGIELDPVYVDVAVRRMEGFTGAPARLAGSELTFAQVADRRGSEDGARDAARALGARRV